MHRLNCSRGSREKYRKSKVIPEISSLLSMHFEGPRFASRANKFFVCVCRQFRAFRHNVGSEARADFGVPTSQDRPVFLWVRSGRATSSHTIRGRAESRREHYPALVCDGFQANSGQDH